MKLLRHRVASEIKKQIKEIGWLCIEVCHKRHIKHFYFGFVLYDSFLFHVRVEYNNRIEDYSEPSEEIVKLVKSSNSRTWKWDIRACKSSNSLVWKLSNSRFCVSCNKGSIQKQNLFKKKRIFFLIYRYMFLSEIKLFFPRPCYFVDY